ncbi:hypothetical protein CHS0354_016683 [Potamilus streckersoni]|uniref:Uncharacterized protein n=1 Tax=Potamilus streckersoni TaxID=2493646 RepID=A0AAE0THI2_9BIVA|nr:hypothetical protein CHS0354_016683 [Potamilus streckersoni]
MKTHHKRKQSRKMTTGNTPHCSEKPYTPKGSSVGLLSCQAKQSSSATVDGLNMDRYSLCYFKKLLHKRATSNSPDCITPTKTSPSGTVLVMYDSKVTFTNLLQSNVSTGVVHAKYASVATRPPKTNVALPLLRSLTAFPLFPIPSSQETKTTRDVTTSLSKLK